MNHLAWKRIPSTDDSLLTAAKRDFRFSFTLSDFILYEKYSHGVKPHSIKLSFTATEHNYLGHE
jgi:hypothetical protein